MRSSAYFVSGGEELFGHKNQITCLSIAAWKESVLDPEANLASSSHQDPVPPKWCFPRFLEEGPTLKSYYKIEMTFLDATELRNVPIIATIGPGVACRGPCSPTLISTVGLCGFLVIHLGPITPLL